MHQAATGILPAWLRKLRGSAVERLPAAQGVILESWDGVPSHREPASPSACVSASLCVSWRNKSLKTKQLQGQGCLSSWLRKSNKLEYFFSPENLLKTKKKTSPQVPRKVFKYVAEALPAQGWPSSSCQLWDFPSQTAPLRTFPTSQALPLKPPLGLPFPPSH